MDFTTINKAQRVFNLHENIIPESVAPIQCKVKPDFANHGKFIARTPNGYWICAYISNRGVRDENINFLHLTFSETQEAIGQEFIAPMIFAGNMDLPQLNVLTKGRIDNACLIVTGDIINLFFSDSSGIHRYIADCSRQIPRDVSDWREQTENFISKAELGDVALMPNGEIAVYGIQNGNLFEQIGLKKKIIAEKNCRRPSVFVDQDGTRHIAFERERRIYYSVVSESKHINEQMVAYFCSSWPSIAVNPHGKVVIAYQGEGKVDLKTMPEAYNNLRPGAGSTVSYATLEENGKWQINDYLRSSEILLKRRSSSSLPADSKSNIFQNHLEEFWHPSLSIDQHGVIWMFFINTTRRHIYFTRFQGEKFGDFYEAIGAIDCPTRYFYIQKELSGKNRIGLMFHAANQVYMDSLPVPEYQSTESRKITFLDNMEIDQMIGMENCLGQWEKCSEPLAFSGGEGMSIEEKYIVWNQVSKTNENFDMCYMSHRGNVRSNWMPGRASSKDGLNWKFEEPFDMSLLSLDGKCFPNSFWRPIYVEDPDEKDKNRRFKGIVGMYQHIDGLEQRCWRSVVSADALNWFIVQEAQIVISGDISVNSHIMIDKEEKNPDRRFKVMLLMGCHSGRGATLYTSPDGINWNGLTWLRENPEDAASACSPYPTGPIIIDPDGGENPWEEEIHDAVIWRENGFMMAHYDAFYFHYNQHTNKALAVSRDGKHFWRIKRGEINMPHGNTGEWDSGRDRTSLPLVVGDELWLYYCGMPASYFADPDKIDLKANAWNHPENAIELRPWQVGLAKLRVDGWAGVRLNRESQAGMFMTIPFDYSGASLLVNGKGLDNVQVEIINAESCEPLKGFEKEKSSFSDKDSINAIVSWKGKHEAPEGKYRLRFVINSLSSSLYSFGFKK
jgi:hypothetical protein